MNDEAEAELLVSKFVGRSPRIDELRQHVLRVASCDVSVLFQGESGTGKELVARMVHGLSKRRTRPFIGVNCAAIHESLLESELFGHEAGAFTGASRQTLGFLRAADGGTILLDEVGDMSEPLQSKLLRVLEERAVVPVGGTKPIPIDVRVIAATHRDLSKAVAEGSFRLDLYYRLNIICLSIPSLRERRSDIPLLATHLSKTTSHLLKMPVKSFTEAAIDAMVKYDWPGNVRELGNAIQHAYVLGNGSTIDVGDLPRNLFDVDKAPVNELPSLQEVVKQHIGRALEVAKWRRARAAQMLAIDRKTLWRMMRRYEIA